MLKISPSRRPFVLVSEVVMVVVALVMASGRDALAAEPSATAFVAAIYQTYVGKHAKGIPLSTRKARALMTPDLLKLIDADARRAAKRGDVPELDGDPFVDAQDWDIKSFAVDIQDSGPGRAQATVALKDAAGPDRKPVVLDLVKTKAGWRIDDFRGGNGSVRTLLTKK